MPTILRQLRQSVFNLSDEYAVGFREVMPTRGHLAGDLATRRAFACALRDGGRGLALVCGPFPDHAETSLETVRSQLAPEFSAIATSVLPIPSKLREPRG